MNKIVIEGPLADKPVYDAAPAMKGVIIFRIKTKAQDPYNDEWVTVHHYCQYRSKDLDTDNPFEAREIGDIFKITGHLSYDFDHQATPTIMVEDILWRMT